jgi:hypothetical protein
LHSSSDWLSLNRWFCSPSCYSSCARNKIADNIQAFAAAKAFCF